MRIAMCSRFIWFDSERTAGLTRITHELSGGLERAENEVHYFEASKPGLLAYLDYLIRVLPSLERPNGSGYYDVYQAITPLEGAYLPPRKTVVTVPDIIRVKYPELGSGKNVLMREAMRRFEAYCVRKACGARFLVCISEETKHDLVELFHVPADKIKVIRLGIRQDLDHKPLKHANLRIGYLGQLNRRKRVDLLIRAIRQVSSLDLELWIGGVGAEERRLRQLAGDDPRIHFYGFVPDSMLGRFYNDLDWFVFPTAVEGYGLPPVEAMACKIPVVMLRDAIVPSDIKSRSVVVDNLVDFVRFVATGGRPSDWLLDSNYQFAKSHRWDTCVTEYERLYKEIA